MTLQRAPRRPSLLQRIFWRGFLVLGLLILLVVLGVAGLNFWMIHAEASRIFIRIEDVPARPVALVLGAGPGSRQFSFRLDTAVQLYRAGKVQRLLVSGEGDAPDPTGSEVALMRQGLIERGIPAAAITRDDAGFRTLDSVARARRIFGLKSVIVVSQQYHLARSLYLADAWSLDAVGFVAPNAGGDYYDTYLREWLARVKAVLDVVALHTQPRTFGPYTPINLDSPPAPSSR